MRQIKGCFVTIHLPYLQPFEDVNKRVSRLAANIPLIHHNLCPLSFVDVPEDLYVNGLLAIRQVGRGNAIDTGEVLSHLAKDLVPENDREHFLKIAKEEITALHEGNFARYRLRPGEFKDWQKRKT
ncbi:MAG: hypothetical protein JRF45_16035 [Deltaproteobacteria bacterium]|nr:hypothetical protein [Deltaproteobacteria bacterium]